MNIKKIYFVRHGATEGNIKGEYQREDIPLSELGFKQAQIVADRFKEIPLNTIIASDMTRAAQTAEVIAREKELKVTHSDLFRELARPTAVRGKTKSDPEVAAIMKDVKENFGDVNWKHSDEENFHDLKSRAEKCIEYIENIEEENILIVTHGFLLKMIVMVLAFGDSLTADMYTRFDKFTFTKNTGITLVEQAEGKYYLLSWNDHEHLGELDIW